MELNKAISQKLKELLTERKMTQYQLYMRSGVPRSTICYLHMPLSKYGSSLASVNRSEAHSAAFQI